MPDLLQLTTQNLEETKKPIKTMSLVFIGFFVNPLLIPPNWRKVGFTLAVLLLLPAQQNVYSLVLL